MGVTRKDNVKPAKILATPVSEVPPKKLGARARNRASLIRAAQRCLISNGPNVTIEYFAEQAEVSPATIYKHFHHKDELFAEALHGLYDDWSEWSFERIHEQTTDPLSVFVLPVKLLTMLSTTHPEFASAVLNSGNNSTFTIRALVDVIETNYQSLVKSGELPGDNSQARFILFSNAGLGFLLDILRGEYKTKDNFLAEFELLFGILGMSKSKLKKILSTPLDVSRSTP